MIRDSHFDHEEIILRAHLARSVAISKALSRLAGWVAHLFKGQGKAAPGLGRPA